MSNILRIEIKEGWHCAGRRGDNLFPNPYAVGCGGQLWTAVLWDDEEDPTFVKTASVDIYIKSERE